MPSLADKPNVVGAREGSPSDQSWPMPVAEFLAGAHLEAADILLIRQRRSLFTAAVQILTGGYFSKASMVFLTPHRDEEFTRHFVIEAGFKGVDLTELASYLGNRSRRYHIGVVRFESAWFTLDQRHHVRAHMLTQIKARYDFQRLFHNLLVSLDRSGFVLLRLFLGPRRAYLRMTNARRRRSLDRFIGPGFVQWSYRTTIQQQIEDGHLPPSVLDELVFCDNLLEPDRNGRLPEIDEDDLLSTTADDMARSRRLVWKYAIVDGLAHRAQSFAEFQQIVSEARQRRRATSQPASPLRQAQET
ncbi:MAG: hypothetical protein ACKVP7_28750 [Hyphomicrobiaceae bacterium]